MHRGKKDPINLDHEVCIGWDRVLESTFELAIDRRRIRGQ